MHLQRHGVMEVASVRERVVNRAGGAGRVTTAFECGVELRPNIDCGAVTHLVGGSATIIVDNETMLFIS